MTTLTILLIAAVATGALIGVTARMPARQILGQCAVMCATVLLFWGLVVLL